MCGVENTIREVRFILLNLTKCHIQRNVVFFNFYVNNQEKTLLVTLFMNEKHENPETKRAIHELA